MSTDKKDSSKADQQNATKPAKIQDLDAAKVADKNADQVKGGLNPQPLPPRFGR